MAFLPQNNLSNNQMLDWIHKHGFVEGFLVLVIAFLIAGLFAGIACFNRRK